MDFDLRQWLLILGPVFIAAVLVHGYFRMRASQNQLKMKLDKSFLSTPGTEVGVDDLSLLKAELPNGGARVIRQAVSPAAVTSPDAVPVLDEAVPAEPELLISAEALGHLEPAGLAEQQPVAAHPSPAAKLPEVGKAPPARLAASEAAAVAQAASQDQAAPHDQAVSHDKAAPASVTTGSDEPAAWAREESSIPKPEMFVVINILALHEPFAGQRLVEILVESDMIFGEMDIFHRMGSDESTQFSLASAVEPGTFNMATIEHFSTPGVTMFMRVHEVSDPVRVLDDMLAVADAIAQELGGEVCDETRSVMTPQTVEHCRQSVREFQFRHSA